MENVSSLAQKDSIKFKIPLVNASNANNVLNALTKLTVMIKLKHVPPNVKNPNSFMKKNVSQNAQKDFT